MPESSAPLVVGRYVLHAPIAKGGMATIHLARLLGAEGFSRTVAVKRLHPHLLDDAELLAMFLDEARIASKVRHPNVVPVLDVIQAGGEVILVEEYVHGVPLDRLLQAARRRKERLPIDVAVAIVAGLLEGLSAAHEARDELGDPLDIVHRDVSPQNVLVGVDGIPRVIDFGVAKASLNAHVTRTGTFKGKLGYMPPEQMRGAVSRAADIYAAGVVLWEALAGKVRHAGLAEPELLVMVARGTAPRLIEAVDLASLKLGELELLGRLQPIVNKAMAFVPEERYATAAEMAQALRDAAPAAAPARVGRLVRELGQELLEGREKVIVAEESSFRRSRAGAPPPSDDEPSSVEPEPEPEPSSASEAGAPESLRASVLPPLPRPGRAQPPLVAALAVVGLLLGGIVFQTWREGRAPASAGAAATGAASPAETVELAPAVPAPAASPAASVTPATSLAASAAPAVSPPPSEASGADGGGAPEPASSPARAPAWSAPRFAPPLPAAKTGPCDPPYHFEGRKKLFKPQCL